MHELDIVHSRKNVSLGLPPPFALVVLQEPLPLQTPASLVSANTMIAPNANPDTNHLRSRAVSAAFVLRRNIGLGASLSKPMLCGAMPRIASGAVSKPGRPSREFMLSRSQYARRDTWGVDALSPLSPSSCSRSCCCRSREAASIFSTVSTLSQIRRSCVRCMTKSYSGTPYPHDCARTELGPVSVSRDTKQAATHRPYLIDVNDDGRSGGWLAGRRGEEPVVLGRAVLVYSTCVQYGAASFKERNKARMIETHTDTEEPQGPRGTLESRKHDRYPAILPNM